MKIVIDTSVFVKIFLNESDSDKAKEIISDIGKGRIEAHAPSLLFYELNGVLVNKLSSVDEINRHMTSFFALIEAGAVTIHDVTRDLLRKAVSVAETDTKGQGHISPYDATFHALALNINAVFVTADKVHFRKTGQIIGSVELLENFDTE